MYEQTSLHLELARQRQDDFLREARNAQLAAEAPRRPSETLTAIRSVVDRVRVAISRQPVPARGTQLQPSA